jgi:hypothetical protein
MPAALATRKNKSVKTVEERLARKIIVANRDSKAIAGKELANK